MVSIRKSLQLARGRKARARAVAASGCFFVRVPRTSSTSIDTEMTRHFGLVHGRQDMFPDQPRHSFYPAHLTAAEARANIGPALFDGLYSFGIVRNPWDRALSFYRYRQRENHIPAAMPFSDYLAALEQRDRRYFWFAPFWMEAAEFLLDASDCPLVTRIVRYESRAEELAEVGERIGLAGLGGERVNVSARDDRSYIEHFDDAARERIARLYARDIAVFGYSFGA